MIGCTEEDEEDFSKASLIENLQKQTDEENFHKKVTGGLFDDYGIEPKEKEN